MTTNMAGIRWVHRELASQGFVVHPFRFKQDLTPSHIDCTFVVLRPHLVLENPERSIYSEDRKIWEENGWKFIMAP